MIRAVIFDMDGLMIDSERVTYECFRKYLKDKDTDMTEEFYKTLLGQTIKVCKQKVLDQFGKDFSYEDCVKQVHEMLDERLLIEGVPIKKGLIELLKYLKENHYKMIVATSSERIRVDKILKNAGILEFFDDSICGDEVENGKPNPEVFLKACEKLGVRGDEALVLEDSEAGIQAAFDGGIKVICVPDMKYPEEKYKKMATMVCDDLSEVETYVKGYCQCK
ncbi:MAG: HAD family phosphatase [Eubacterium sp.]|nr:HAD family phosphatase [Eubacterium sp.]